MAIIRMQADPPRQSLDLLQLLRPAPVDPEWEAEKAGWRCFVMGNHHPSFRKGTRLRSAWQRGFDAAAQSAEPERLML